MLAVKQTIQRIGIVFIVAICTIACITSAIIITSPFFSQYQQTLAKTLTETLGVPVRIDNVSAGWYGLYPKFTLRGVTILSQETQRPIAKCRKLELGISLWQTLLHREWTASSLILSGADVVIEKGLQGRWRLFEDNASSPAYEIPQHALSWVFSQKKLRLEDVNVQWRLDDGRVFPLQHLQVSLSNKNDRHMIQGFGKFAQLVPTTFKFHGRIISDTDDLAHAHGQVMLQLRDVELSQWLRSQHYAGLKINNGKVDANLKLSFNGKSYQALTGYIDGQNINLLVKGTEHARLIQHLQSSFSAMHNGGHWELKTPNTEVRVQGKRWPVNQLYIAFEDTDAPLFYTKIDYLQAKPLMVLLRDNTATPQPIRDLLAHLKPTGEFRDLQIQYGLNNQQWSVHSGFRQFSSTGWRQYPGIDNLAGFVELSPAAGKLELRGHKVTLDHPTALNHSLPIDLIMGDVSWHKQGTCWDIDAQNLYLKTANMEVNADMAWHGFPRPQAELGLSGGFNLKHPKAIVDTFPIERLSPELASWLSFSVSDRGLIDGKFVVQGDVDKFPFKDNSGKLLVSSHIKDGRLRFQRHWPAAEDLYGDLTFLNNTMSATIHQGTIQDVPFSDIQLDIPDMGKDKKVLSINGDIDSDFSTARQFVMNSPLKSKLATITDLNLTGPMRLNLDLKIPLLKSKPNIIHGAVIAKNAALNLPDWYFGLQNLNGQVDFHDEDIKGHGLHGELFHHPVKIGVTTTNNKSAKTHVTLDGAFGVDDIPAQWHIKQSSYFKGVTDYHAKFTVPHNPKLIRRLQLKSNLQGLAINYPKPLKKPSASQWPLLFTALFHDKGDIDIISHLAKLANLHGQFKYQAGKLVNQGMTVHFGKDTTKFKPQAGITIDGKLDDIDLKDWLAVYQGLDNHELPVGDIARVDVTVKKLYFYDLLFRNTQVTLSPSPQQWNLSLKGDRLDGTVSVPTKHHKKVQAHFKRLDIPKLAAKTSVPESIDWSSLPDSDINIQQLAYQGLPLGQCQLSLLPSQTGLSMSHFKLSTPHYTLAGQGSWNQKSHNTHLNGNVAVQSISHIQSLLKVPHFIHAERANAQFDFAWPGEFYKPTVEQLSGHVNYKIAHGKIHHLGQQTEKQLGFGKLISLISLQALPHHLATDFKDVSGKGFPFSKWDGNINIKQGKANITKSELDGPVAYVEFDGDIDIPKKHCLLQLKVVPYLGASLPVLAAVAGGPVIGMATFMATEIIGSEIKRNAHYAYSLSGPWDNLSINEIYRPQRHTYHPIN